MRQPRSLRSIEAKRFEQIFADTQPEVLAFVRRRVWDPHDVVDVVAEVYTVAWRRIDTVPQGGEARLWLFRTAGYCIANFRRGVRRHNRLGAKLAAVLDEFVVEPPDDDGEEIRSVLAMLSAGDRDILLMSAADGLSAPEIATVLDVTPEAARARLSRARTRLRTLLLSQQDAGGHEESTRISEVRKL